jgi:hypothetical protein
VEVTGRDVVEVNAPDLPDAERGRTRAGAGQVVELEHGHVRAVAAAVEEAARRRVVSRGRDHLDERVAERHDRVAKPEVVDVGIGVRVAQRQGAAEVGDGGVEVAGRDHGLTKAKHRATLPR